MLHGTLLFTNNVMGPMLDQPPNGWHYRQVRNLADKTTRGRICRWGRVPSNVSNARTCPVHAMLGNWRNKTTLLVKRAALLPRIEFHILSYRSLFQKSFCRSLSSVTIGRYWLAISQAVPNNSRAAASAQNVILLIAS